MEWLPFFVAIYAKYARSVFYKIDGIPSFDIRHSIFCGSSVLFSV